VPKKKATLSKSRFKLVVECPTKVYYSLDRRYVNTKIEDEFLQALADGGYQVGERMNEESTEAWWDPESPAYDARRAGSHHQVAEAAPGVAGAADA